MEIGSNIKIKTMGWKLTKICANDEYNDRLYLWWGLILGPLVWLIINIIKNRVVSVERCIDYNREGREWSKVGYKKTGEGRHKSACAEYIFEHTGTEIRLAELREVKCDSHADAVDKHGKEVFHVSCDAFFGESWYLAWKKKKKT